MADDSDEWERMVEGILKQNAALAQVVPSQRLRSDEFSRALPAPPRPLRQSILDEIMAELSSLQSGATNVVTAEEARAGLESRVSGGQLNAIREDLRPPADKIVGLHDHPCPVCLCETTRSQFSLLAPCFHRFCYSCIVKWLKVGRQAGTCPTCRAPPVTLIYSIRNADDYKYRLLNEEAPSVVGDLDPSTVRCTDAAKVKSFSNSEDEKQIAEKSKLTSITVGSKRLRELQTSDDVGTGSLPSEFGEPAQQQGASSRDDAPCNAIPTAPVSSHIPRAMMQALSDGSLESTVEETNRVRAILGLRPLK